MISTSDSAVCPDKPFTSDKEEIELIKPLEGVRVIDLSTYLAAPSVGRLMAEWGAEVRP